MRTQLQLMVDSVTAGGCNPTIGVTAANLDRHPGISADLSGLDLMVHGYHHIGYSTLTKEEQERDLDCALRTFSASGLHANGFRAPYLDTDEVTRPIVRARGLAYDSSSCYVALGPESQFRHTVLKLALDRYGNAEGDPQSPHVESDIVEVPVCLPDDELLIDALGFRNPELIRRVFTSMLGSVARRNSALVLQVHPERFSLCNAAIKEVLLKATDLGAWRANLTELAEWIRLNPGLPQRWPDGHSFALVVTGDLDALSLSDFGRRLWRRIS
jgi:peptidoglycan/xylan/chitin deacetylase (PgdA/CDA1 family)